MDEVNTDRFDDLRKEWELDKSPRLSLQLAEEYGRRADYLSAITVLRTGLTHHPRHVASRVLLARFLVALEQWPEARETLEKVASEDPTHLVANKLLVRTHVATGDLEEARNRLDLYTLLNGSDPDIEELEDALAGSSSGAQVPVAAPRPPAPGLDEAAIPVPAAASDGQGGQAEVEAEELPVVETSPEPPVTAPPAASDAAPDAAPDVAPDAAPDDEPFGDLFGVSGRARGEASARADSIFELARPTAMAKPGVTAPAKPAPQERATAEVAADGVAEAPPAAEPAPGPGLREPDPREARPATVSLGRLYLQQGHSSEAERTFMAVLERSPDNAAARAGLAAARGSGGWRLAALDLVSRETLDLSAPAERKKAVLTGYLERLRAGGAPS